MKTRKEIIQNTIIDMVSNLMYYDRKEDVNLPIGAIEEAIENGEITINEIVAQFQENLEDGLDN